MMRLPKCEEKCYRAKNRLGQSHKALDYRRGILNDHINNCQKKRLFALHMRTNRKSKLFAQLTAGKITLSRYSSRYSSLAIFLL